MKDKDLSRAIWLIAALTLFRIGALIFTQAPIHGDEAQYWSWAKDLDFGYYSKPPMIGWVIAFSTTLFGDGAFGVRFLSPLLHGGTALIILAIGRHLFGNRVGAWSGITYALIPGVSWASTLISTDTPLLFFIALATLFYVRGNAVGTGFGLGLGFLSKYAMSYWLIGAALDQALRKDRWSLGQIAIMLTIGVAVLVPNIIWNAGQDFVTVAHLGENANLHSKAGGLSGLVDFWGSQFGVFGPFIFLALIAALASPTTWRDPNMRTLALLALPPLIVVSTQAVLSRANANWAVAAYVPSVPLIANWLITHARFRFVLPATLGLHGIVAALIAVVIIFPASIPYRPLEKAHLKLMVGPDLGAALEGRMDLPLLTDDRMTTALILYYRRADDLSQMRRLPHPQNAITDHYQMTRPLDYCDSKGLHLLVARRANVPNILSAIAKTEQIKAGRFTYHLTIVEPSHDGC
ncbi:MAG: ArnT family glycosyltransferase [Alphaproteobacteria bacterium]